MFHELHLMLEEQRHREHMREADEHRRAKELRQARGEVSIWGRLSERMNLAKSADKSATTHSGCVCTGCEPAMSESI